MTQQVLDALLYEILPMLVVFLSPLWFPAAILIYHTSTAPSIWRFSLRFLLVLIVAECVALGASVSAGRYLFR